MRLLRRRVARRQISISELTLPELMRLGARKWRPPSPDNGTRVLRTADDVADLYERYSGVFNTPLTLANRNDAYHWCYRDSEQQPFSEYVEQLLRDFPNED